LIDSEVLVGPMLAARCFRCFADAELRLVDVARRLRR
jgi:hypothetical protein